MHAVNLLPPPGGLSPEAAARWVDAALAEAKAMRDFDGELLPLDTDDPALLERAKRLRAEWGRWAEDAEQLRARVEGLPGVDAGQYRELCGMIGYGRILSRQSIEVLRERWEKVKAGDYVTGEELRRELGLPRRR